MGSCLSIHDFESKDLDVLVKNRPLTTPETSEGKLSPDETTNIPFETWRRFSFPMNRLQAYNSHNDHHRCYLLHRFLAAQPAGDGVLCPYPEYSKKGRAGILWSKPST